MKFLVSTFFTRRRTPTVCHDICNIIPARTIGAINVGNQRFHHGKGKVNTCIQGDYCIVRNVTAGNKMNNYADELRDYNQYVLLHLDQIKWKWK